MSKREVINTVKAPTAIGPYSQAIKAGKTIYLSGQIPLVPETMALAGIDIVTRHSKFLITLPQSAKLQAALWEILLNSISI